MSVNYRLPFLTSQPPTLDANIALLREYCVELLQKVPDILSIILTHLLYNKKLMRNVFFIKKSKRKLAMRVGDPGRYKTKNKAKKIGEQTRQVKGKATEKCVKCKIVLTCCKKASSIHLSAIKPV